MEGLGRDGGQREGWERRRERKSEFDERAFVESKKDGQKKTDGNKRMRMRNGKKRKRRRKRTGKIQKWERVI